MPRWRQVVNEDGSSEFVPLDENYTPPPRVHIIGDAPRFISPITKKPVEGKKELREHNRRHNVVHQSEFGDNFGKSWFDKKQKERDSFSEGRDPKHRADVKKDLLKNYEKLQNKGE